MTSRRDEAGVLGSELPSPEEAAEHSCDYPEQRHFPFFPGFGDLMGGVGEYFNQAPGKKK